VATVLIVDDVRPLAEQYAFDLKRLGGFKTLLASGGQEALEFLSRTVIDCVILDLEMPGMDGFDVLRALDHHGIDVPVIVYTGTGSFDRCVEAVRLGALGFVDKNEPMERVVQEVRLALGQARLQREVHGLEERLQEGSPLLGESDAMDRLRSQIVKLAAIESPVLILGESGTGKELVAKELHGNGPRREGPFVALNSGGLSQGLVDSDLFGHERGAFTGAVKARRGAFELADEGTLFLDEIGELPLGTQAKLLRVLEVGEVRRLGSEDVLRSTARVVAATHRDLDVMVAEGAFREDLLFRLNVHVIQVPPLRDRPEDIPLLVDTFVTSLSPRLGTKPRPVTDSAMSLLRGYRWARNNVRELRNVVERMIISTDGPVLDAQHVPQLTGSGGAPPRGGSVSTAASVDAVMGSFKDRRASAEREIIVETLGRHGGKVGRAAQELGLADHASLLKIMRRLGIQRT